MSETLNKALLKKFAVDARNELRDKISLKASLYGITKDISDKDRETKGDKTFIKNEDVIIEFNNQKRTLSKDEASQRTALIDKIQRINKEGRDGFNEVIEEVAYTWFNRFVALRYMEVNGYLQSRVNVLASRDGSNTPEIITEAMNVNLPIDKNLVYELKVANKNEELYSYLVELQCSELNKSLPFMFEKIGHYAELLFPTGVISSKFFKTLIDIESITEDDWSNVEIIGWLYQYYISEEKDRVIKAKKKYKKNEIPFATQLFTPDWIVRYMVQNTLGRYWIESHKEDEDLKENWEFYLENPEKEPDFDEKIAPYLNKELEVEDIKCFDPACGSGHILVYMFDVLYEIYSRCGYSRGDIPMLIIEKNLYGLDIDKRAYQLACFAVIMKGMSYDKLLLRKIERQVDKEGIYINLNIACIQETNILYEDEDSSLHDNIAFLAGEESGETYDGIKVFVESLKNANTYGSLTKVEEFDKEFLEKRLEDIKSNPGTDFFGNKAREKWEFILEDLIKQASIMGKTYDILVTNPPYMGSKYMNPILTEFINDNYENTKSDLFSAFIEYCFKKVRKEGHLGMITPFVWMFISVYESLREQIVKSKNISSLIQLEYNAFPEACVPVCCFTLRNDNIDLNGEFIKLLEFQGSENQLIKTLEAIENKVDYRYSTKSNKFSDITGSPIAYWANESVRKAFRGNNSIYSISTSASQNVTGNNKKYVRFFWEVSKSRIGVGKKWLPYAKGGGYRKWYGNLIDVVDWSYEAREEYRTGHGSQIIPENYWYKQGITWGLITSALPSFRVLPNGSTFDKGGSSIFVNDGNLYKYVLSYLNSNVALEFLRCLNITLNFQVRDIRNLPIIYGDIEKVNDMFDKIMEVSKDNWDWFEISNDFKHIELIEMGKCNKYIGDAIKNIKNSNLDKMNILKEKEESLNKYFIKLFEVEDCVDYKVEGKYVSLKKIDECEIIQSLMSYFIGCLMGRYSLDKDGIVFAGGEFDINEYNKFLPNKDNIIPILNTETKYFEDDVMGRFEEFLKVTFGDEYLIENIDFIAKALEKKPSESSREAIRRYFTNEFFNEHCKMYKKRPIYWLFTSGKNKAFNCLVYMHRIDKNLLSKMRMDYVQPLQNKLEVEQKDLMDTLNSDATIKDKKDAKKKLGIVEKQIDELKVFHEKLRHMADKQIQIDLDDGVIYNHGLFGDLVSKIK